MSFGALTPPPPPSHLYTYMCINGSAPPPPKAPPLGERREKEVKVRWIHRDSSMVGFELNNRHAHSHPHHMTVSCMSHDISGNSFLKKHTRRNPDPDHGLWKRVFSCYFVLFSWFIFSKVWISGKFIYLLYLCEIQCVYLGRNGHGLNYYCFMWPHMLITMFVK